MQIIKIKIFCQSNKAYYFLISQRKLRPAVEDVYVEARSEIYNNCCYKTPSCPSHCTVYTLDTFQTLDLCIGLFADYICIYVCDRQRKEFCFQKAAARPHCY